MLRKQNSKDCKGWIKNQGGGVQTRVSNLPNINKFF